MASMKSFEFYCILNNPTDWYLFVHMELSQTLSTFLNTFSQIFNLFKGAFLESFLNTLGLDIIDLSIGFCLDIFKVYQFLGNEIHSLYNLMGLMAKVLSKLTKIVFEGLLNLIFQKINLSTSSIYCKVNLVSFPLDLFKTFRQFSFQFLKFFNSFFDLFLKENVFLVYLILYKEWTDVYCDLSNISDRTHEHIGDNSIGSDGSCVSYKVRKTLPKDHFGFLGWVLIQSNFSERFGELIRVYRVSW